MKPSIVFRLCAVIALVLPLAALAQSAAGVIEGRVYNAATGSALVNARVTLEGAGREVITDEAGSFRLTGVPAGEARINVAYLGMAPQKATVSVAPGAEARRDFELVLDRAVRSASADTIKLDAFTVTAAREMSAQAISINEQRNAPNIKNVVAVDEFGDRGSENIGEFLLFLPRRLDRDVGVGAHDGFAARLPRQ